MKHRRPDPQPQTRPTTPLQLGTVPDPPTAARTVFGAALATAQTYARLLAGSGVERGLIGPREVERLWDRHLLNSTALSVAVPDGADVADVGSGAGLPGVPLALARPDLPVTLVEPLLRRATFLAEVVERLELGNVEVVRARAEDLPRHSTDVVVARAVAPLSRLASWTLPLIRPSGRLVALKGRSAEAEVVDAADTLRRLGARSWEVRDLPVPDGTAATRAVVVVAGETRRQR